MKELVIRMIYVEMLGQDASFAYIKAVELCAATSISQKRAGYLAGLPQCLTRISVHVSNSRCHASHLFAAALCLSPQHEFRFMLVNQIQRDMNSTNVLEISAALAAVNKIVTEDMIPAVIGDVSVLCDVWCVVCGVCIVNVEALNVFHLLGKVYSHRLRTCCNDCAGAEAAAS